MVVCSTHCSSIKVYLNPTSFYCQVTSGTWIHYKAFSMTHANRMDCIWTGTLEITVYTMQPPYWKDTLTSYRKRWFHVSTTARFVPWWVKHGFVGCNPPSPILYKYSHNSLSPLDHHEHEAATTTIADHFRQLVQKLPIPHQHLLLYLVDLLSLFASNADANSMDASKLADIFTPRILGESCGKHPHQAQSLVQFLIGSQALFMKQLYHHVPQKETTTNMHVNRHPSPPPLMAPKPVRPIPISLITKESITFVPPTLHHHHHAKQPRHDGGGSHKKRDAMQKSCDDSSSSNPHTIATTTNYCQTTTSVSSSTFQRARSLMDAKIKVLIRSWQGWYYIHKGG